MAIRQSRRPPAFQSLAEDIRTEITSGRLRCGQRLPTEPEMCTRTGLSRSTVREALRLLASQNLVTTVRGVAGGSFVTQPSITQLTDTLSTGLALLLSTSSIGIAELLEIREMLEVPATGQAAHRRTPAHLAVLGTALIDFDADDLDDMLRKHRVFHHAIAAASGNPLCELLSHPLYHIANERTLLTTAPAGFWPQVDADHRETLRRLTDGDADGAERAARAHVDYLRGVYVTDQRER
jgi:GntR family transcriptional repressor for pyruvate dehydrogenase complex